MKSRSLRERLREIYSELGFPPKKVFPEKVKKYMVGTNSAELQLATIYRLAESLEAEDLHLIPVVLHDSHGAAETLGIEGFLAGNFVDNYVGRVFEKYRLRLGLEQQEVADLVDVNPADICRYEKGPILPKVGRFETICRVLKLSPEYLVPKSGKAV